MGYLQNNAGVNYTLYYSILDYFKTIMVNHPTIAQVSQGDIPHLDDNQFTLYPIGNVSILGANFGSSTTEYDIQLIVADKIKNKNNESAPRENTMQVPFFDVNDLVDIHANTLAVINDLVSYTQYSLESFQILDTITNEPFADRFNNGLAGWVCNFTLTTHNDRPRCLYNLYPYNNPATTTTTTTTASPTTTSTTTAAPTTTTTAVPLDFIVSYNCTFSPDTLDLNANTPTAGVSPYSFGSIYFSSEAAALANTSWIETTAISYGATPINVTYWIVLKDNVGTLKAKSVTSTCFSTTTAAP